MQMNILGGRSVAGLSRCWWLICLIPMSGFGELERVLFAPGAFERGGWQVVNDGVMGGVSTSRMEVSAAGTAVFTGEVSLENNGGFASVRGRVPEGEVRGCEAFRIRVRGDGKRYKFTVRLADGVDAPIYQAAFGTRAGEWEEHRLPMARFVASNRGRSLPNAPAIDPARVVQVGFLVSDKQAGPFRLEIGWIKAVP